MEGPQARLPALLGRGGERLVYWSVFIPGRRAAPGAERGIRLSSPRKAMEESLALKRKLVILLLAVVVAAMMPKSALGQIEEDRPKAPATAPIYKYVAFAGWGYTSINQVNQSRSGLQGVSYSVTRNWGRFFGITAVGGHYAWSVTQSNALVGNPSMDLLLVGPEIRAPLFGPLDLFVHGLLGGAHTGNVSISPTVSFAGGLGMGMDYNLNKRFAIRLSGDDIASSFTLVPYASGDSPHKRWNARASMGVAYRF